MWIMTRKLAIVEASACYCETAIHGLFDVEGFGTYLPLLLLCHVAVRYTKNQILYERGINCDHCIVYFYVPVPNVCVVTNVHVPLHS